MGDDLENLLSTAELQGVGDGAAELQAQFPKMASYEMNTTPLSHKQMRLVLWMEN